MISFTKYFGFLRKRKIFVLCSLIIFFFILASNKSNQISPHHDLASKSPQLAENSVADAFHLNWSYESNDNLSTSGPNSYSERMPIWTTDSGVYTWWSPLNDVERLEKHDHNGNSLWNSTWASPRNESTARDLWSDGQYLYGCGSTTVYYVEQYHDVPVIVKWDLNGNEIKHRYESPTDDRILGFSICGIGNSLYMLSDWYNLTYPRYNGFILSKYDSNTLNSNWNISFSRSETNYQLYSNVLVTDGTYLYVIGYRYGELTYRYEQMIFCLDLNGNVVWEKYYPYIYGHSYATDGICLGNDLYVLGHENYRSYQMFIHKLNKNTGDSLQNITLGNASMSGLPSSKGYAIASNSTHFFVVGEYNGDGLLLSLDVNGNFLYNQTFGGETMTPYARSIAVTNNQIYLTHFRFEPDGIEWYYFYPVLNQYIYNTTRFIPVIPPSPSFITRSQNFTSFNIFQIQWNPVPNAIYYAVYLNGSHLVNTTNTYYNWTINSTGVFMFQVRAVNNSGISEFSEMIVLIVTTPPSDTPFFTPIIVVGATVGSFVGIGMSQVPQARQILNKEFWKNRRYLSKKDAPLSSNSSEIVQNPAMQNNSIAIGTNLNFNDMISSLKAMWESIPSDLRDLLVKGMDKYLKFKDEAELALMTTFYNLSQGFLNVCHLYRDGNFTESLAKLKEIEQKSHEIKFTDLSNEAKLMQTDSMNKISPGGSK